MSVKQKRHAAKDARVPRTSKQAAAPCATSTMQSIRKTVLRLLNKQPMTFAEIESQVQIKASVFEIALAVGQLRMQNKIKHKAKTNTYELRV